MKMSGRYALGLYAGVTGILALVAINAFSIPSSLEQAEERSRITANAQLEQTKAEAAKKVASAYSKNAIATYDQLIIDGYTLNNQPPSLNWKLIDPFKKPSFSTNPANVPATHYRENSTSPNITKEFVT